MLPSKEDIRTLLYTRLTTLLNSQDEEIAIKAVKELGTIAGIYAEVSPRQISAHQTNNFTIPEDKLAAIVSNLKQIAPSEQIVEAVIEEEANA